MCTDKSSDNPNNLGDLVVCDNTTNPTLKSIHHITDTQSTQLSSDIVSKDATIQENSLIYNHTTDTRSNSSDAFTCAEPDQLSCEIHAHNPDIQSNIQIIRSPPNLTKETWEEINTEFAILNRESWNKLRTRNNNPEEFITDLNTTLANFLKSKPEFQHEAKQFFEKHKEKSHNVEDMKEKKILLCKKAKQKDATDEDKQAACEAVRMYNYMLNMQKEKDLTKLAQEQENSYRKDFCTRSN